MKKNGNLCYFFDFNNESSFLRAVRNSRTEDIKKIKNAQQYANKFSILAHNLSLQKILI